MAELVDAHASGACIRKDVEVRVLFWAPCLYPPPLTLRTLHRLSQYALLFLLAFAILWKGGKSLETTWLLAGIAWFCTLTYWNRRREAPSIPLWLWLSLLLFLGWSVLSFVFSATQNYGLDELLRDASLILLFFWVVRVASSDEGNLYSRRFVRVLSLGALVACAIGVAVYALQPVSRFVGTFFDLRFHTDYWPNAWAQFLLLAWPMLLLWALKQAGKMRWALLLALGFLLGGLFLSYSRGGVIAFAGQAALLALLLLPRMRERWKPLLLSIVTVAAVAGATFGLANLLRSQTFAVQSVAEKVTFTADEGTSSFSERRDFWMQAITLAGKRPLLGWGPYSFRFVQPRLQKGVLQTSDHPHNLLLKLAMERGWPAASLFIVVVVLITVRYFQSRFASQDTRHKIQDTNNSRSLYLVAIAGVIAHNLIDYNLQFVGIALPFWIILGLLFATSSKLVASRLPLITPQKFTEVAMATVLIVVSILEGGYLLLTSVGRHWQAQGRRDDAVLVYEAAHRQIFSRDLHLSHAVALLQGNRFAEVREVLDRYQAQNEEDFRLSKLEGDLAMHRFDYETAYYAYAKAYETAKWNDLGSVRVYLESLMRLRRGEEMQFRLQEIREILQAFAEAIDRNTHHVALSSNVEEFEKVASLMALVEPADAQWYRGLAEIVKRAGERERKKVKARRPGFLW